MTNARRGTRLMLPRYRNIALSSCSAGEDFGKVRSGQLRSPRELVQWKSMTFRRDSSTSLCLSRSRIVFVHRKWETLQTRGSRRIARRKEYGTAISTFTWLFYIESFVVLSRKSFWCIYTMVARNGSPKTSFMPRRITNVGKKIVFKLDKTVLVETESLWSRGCVIFLSVLKRFIYFHGIRK